MGLMSYIHRQLLKRGRLDDLLPGKVDLEDDNKTALEAARADLEARQQEERKIRREVDAAIKRLKELNKQNHYGESLRRAFGGQ